MLSKLSKSILFAVCFIFLMLISLKVPTVCHGLDIEIIEIVVSPNTLNLKSRGHVVTVHTDIAYAIVDHTSVSLNGIDISSWKADDRGYFVAKFLMSEVKALADSEDLDVPGENKLVLVGYTIAGNEFTGSDDITVIDIDPAGR